MSGNAHSSNRDYAGSGRVSGFDSDGSPEPVLRLPRKNLQAKKGLYLDRSQLVVFWSAIAGMMVFVFITGFHAGRNQGREALLESVSREAVRLPILAAANSQATQQLEIPSSSDSASLAKETKFDFAGSVALKNPVRENQVIAVKSVKSKKKETSAPGALAPGWYIQVEAAKSESELNTIKERFKAGGFSPVVHKGMIREKVFYQVVLGPYQSRIIASGVGKQVKEKELSRIQPFVRKF